jgi:O-antigen ligase
MRKALYRLSLVLIFTIPWEGAVRFPGFGTGSKLIGIAVGGLWVATVVLTRQVRRPPAFLVVAFVFVLWIALSVFWSADVSTSLPEALAWFQQLGLAFVLWDVFRTRRAVLAGLQAYVLGAFVAVAWASANYLAGNPFYTHYDRFSPGDTNPDGFGFLLALAVPVAWYLAALAGSERAGRWRVVNYAYLPVAFLGLALSGTRTALIAALVGMLFGLATVTRLRPWARIAVAVLLASAVYLLLPVVAPLRSFERLGTTGTELTQGDLNGRLEQWQQGLASFSDHPLLGVGVNMYRSVNNLGKVAHNSYLSVLVELGLVGFVLFASILALVLMSALAHRGWERAFWLTLLLVWAIGASTLTWEHRNSTWLFLTLAVASASTRVRERVATASPGARVPTRGRFVPALGASPAFAGPGPDAQPSR